MTVSNPSTDSTPQPKPAVARPSLKLRFYRQCRLWHGYLSACAFTALLFFAVTGIALNHPKWFAANQPRSAPVKVMLTPLQLRELRDSPTPAEMLVKIAGEQTTLYGKFRDGARAMDQVFARLRGARGSTDIRANLEDGSVVVTLERATTIGLFNALHRGEQAGAAWQFFMDMVATVLIVLALAGYAIFFSMNARLKTALLITGVSALGTIVLFIAWVR